MALLVGAAQAADLPRSAPLPPGCPCPGPASLGVPIPSPLVWPDGSATPRPAESPRTPGEPASPGASGQTPPSTPPATDSANPAANSDFASASQAGTEGGGSFSPNMFGDAFARPLSATIPRPVPAVNVNFPGAAIPAVFNATQSTSPGAVTFTSQSAFSRFGTSFPSGTTYMSQGAVPGTLFLVPGPGFSTTVTPIPVAQNAAETAAAQRFAAAQYGAGGTLTYLQSQSNATLMTPGVMTPTGTFPSTYTLDTEYNYLIPGTATLNAPNPSGGGTVGRVKISDDNSPLPRDRFFLQYDYFDNAPVVPHGAAVHRFGRLRGVVPGWAGLLRALPALRGHRQQHR